MWLFLSTRWNPDPCVMKPMGCATNASTKYLLYLTLGKIHRKVHLIQFKWQYRSKLHYCNAGSKQAAMWRKTHLVVHVSQSETWTWSLLQLSVTQTYTNLIILNHIQSASQKHNTTKRENGSEIIPTWLWNYFSCISHNHVILCRSSIITKQQLGPHHCSTHQNLGFKLWFMRQRHNIYTLKKLFKTQLV